MFYQLNERAHLLESRGRRIIRMNLGKTCLPTPPVIVSRGIESMAAKKADYGPVMGNEDLLKAIARREGCSVENIVIGPGSKQLIWALISVLSQQGSRVLMPSPFWPAYRMMCKALLREPVEIATSPENGWLIDNLPLDGASMLILCNPLNPASTVYPDELVSGIISDAEKRGVAVVMDEAYRGLAFCGIDSPQCIRVRSFSKEFNMEGWRLGYITAPKAVAKKVAEFLQLTVTCVPGFVQDAGIAALEHEDEILAENRLIWKERLQTAEPLLRKAGFDFVTPQSGIYVFMTHKGLEGRENFCSDLLEKGGVAVAPGNCFGTGLDGYIRITLNQPADVLTEALEIMHRFV